MTVVQTSPVARRPLTISPKSSPHPSPPTITLAVVIVAAVVLGALFTVAMIHEDTLRQPASEGLGDAELADDFVLIPTLPTVPPTEATESATDVGTQTGDAEGSVGSSQSDPSAASRSAGSTSAGATSDNAGSGASDPGAVTAPEPLPAHGRLTAVDSSGGQGAFFDASAPAGTFTPGAELIVRLDGRTMSVVPADSVGGATAVIGWVDDPNPPAPGSHTLEIGEAGGNSVTTTIVVGEPPG